MWENKYTKYVKYITDSLQTLRVRLFQITAYVLSAITKRDEMCAKNEFDFVGYTRQDE